MIANVGQIWKAASTEKSRERLLGVFFDADKGLLSATDSYIMARVPCQVEPGDESGVIPAAALKEAAGRSLKIADGKAVLTLPDGERVWKLLLIPKAPDFDGVISLAVPVEHPFGFDPKLLLQLGSALGTDEQRSLALHVVHPLRGARVTTEKGEGEGVLMPIRLASRNGFPDFPKPIDLSDDDKVVNAARAAVSAMDKKRGKKRAAEAFRKALKAEEVVA